MKLDGINYSSVHRWALSVKHNRSTFTPTWLDLLVPSGWDTDSEPESESELMTENIVLPHDIMDFLAYVEGSEVEATEPASPTCFAVPLSTSRLCNVVLLFTLHPQHDDKIYRGYKLNHRWYKYLDTCKWPITLQYFINYSISADNTLARSVVSKQNHHYIPCEINILLTCINLAFTTSFMLLLLWWFHYGNQPPIVKYVCTPST